MTEVSVQSLNGITTMKASIIINATSDQVWNILSKPGNIVNFHPLIKRSYMVGKPQHGKGAKRHCDLLPMGAMNEQITDWVEGESFTAEVIGGKMLPPYKFMRGTVKVLAEGNKCKVTFCFKYQLKFGALGKLMDILIIRPQFRKAPPKYVYGLKKYAEHNSI